MVYAFICKNCDTKQEVERRGGDTRPPVCHCGTITVRDYKTEWSSQRVHIPLHMSSRNTSVKSDFLPSEKDFESPEDPTGSKGMKEWKDTHQVKGHKELI